MTFRAVAGLLLSVVVAFLFYYGALWLLGTDGVVESFARLALTTWLIVLGLSLANYVLRFLRWHWYIKEVHEDRVPSLLLHLVIYVAGFALTTTPGKAGEALRSIYLTKYGISLGKSLAVLFVERVMDLVVVLLLSLFCVAMFQDEGLLWVAGLVAACIVTLVTLINSSMLRSLLVRFKSDGTVLGKALTHALDMLDVATGIMKPKKALFGLSIGIVAWTCEGIGLYLILDGLGVDLDAVIAIGIYALSMLVGAVSFLPGGIGGAEVSMGLMLMTGGADEQTAVVATLICRVATLWFAVVLGIMAIGVLALNGEKVSLMVPQNKMGT